MPDGYGFFPPNLFCSDKRQASGRLSGFRRIIPCRYVRCLPDCGSDYAMSIRRIFQLRWGWPNRWFVQCALAHKCLSTSVSIERMEHETKTRAQTSEQTGKCQPSSQLVVCKMKKKQLVWIHLVFLETFLCLSCIWIEAKIIPKRRNGVWSGEPELSGAYFTSFYFIWIISLYFVISLRDRPMAFVLCSLQTEHFSCLGISISTEGQCDIIERITQYEKEIMVAPRRKRAMFMSFHFTVKLM